MAALPKFSFSGWTSQSLAPKVNPAAVPITTPGLGAPAPGQLVAQTNAANNLPQWLNDEVAKLNAAQALRTQMAGQVTGQPSTAGDLGAVLQGIAANTAARGGFNQQVFGMNEAARLQNLIQQRNQLSPVGGFGFNNPMDVSRQIGLDREIEAYRNVNLPISAGGNFRPSGWASPNWAQPTWR